MEIINELRRHQDESDRRQDQRIAELEARLEQRSAELRNSITDIFRNSIAVNSGRLSVLEARPSCPIVEHSETLKELGTRLDNHDKSFGRIAAALTAGALTIFGLLCNVVYTMLTKGVH